MQSWLTTSYPDLWLLFLGGLFMGVVLFFPDGATGAAVRAGRAVYGLVRRAPARAGAPEGASSRA
jgi:urea transport system permease protein